MAVEGGGERWRWKVAINGEHRRAVPIEWLDVGLGEPRQHGGDAAEALAAERRSAALGHLGH